MSEYYFQRSCFLMMRFLRSLSRHDAALRRNQRQVLQALEKRSNQPFKAPFWRGHSWRWACSPQRAQTRTKPLAASSPRLSSTLPCSRAGKNQALFLVSCEPYSEERKLNFHTLTFLTGPVLTGATLSQRTHRRHRAPCALFCSRLLGFF